MAKIFSLIISFMILCVSISVAQQRSTLDLAGVWTGNQLRVEFIDNTRVAVVFPGNKKQVGTYTADFLLNPSILEMSFNDGNKKLEFKCLVQFVENNTLKWEVFAKTDYPRNFSRAISILKRVKN